MSIWRRGLEVRLGSVTCLFPLSVERLSFHLRSYTGVCRHTKGSRLDFMLLRFTENYEVFFEWFD